MNRQTITRWVAGLAMLMLAQGPAWACAVCFGEPGAPMTRGLNWAILVLGGVVGVVLTGVAGFFVYVQRRATTHSRQPLSHSKTSNS